MQTTIGCDPEFLLKTPSGRNTNVNFEFTDATGNVGKDHGGCCGELRPKQGSPAEVTERIRKQLLRVKQYLLENDMTALKVVAGGGAEIMSEDDRGHSFQSIGGHIHFGGIRLNRTYVSYTRQRNWYHQNNQVFESSDSRLVAALDYFIGNPLQLVKGGARPKGSPYGTPADIESKPHGFEYRTPPSWITDPYLTESTLCVAQQIADMWRVKVTAFDHLFGTNPPPTTATEIKRRRRKKKAVRPGDYNMLIPESGPNRQYVADQINKFKTVIFSETYRMDTNELLDLWTDEEKLKRLYGFNTAIPITAGIEVATVQVKRNSSRIVLQICQIKLIEGRYTTAADTFYQETVLKCCRFALPEVKVYNFPDYTPYNFGLVRDIRLRADTLYISRELRKYLRVKRGFGLRVRFVDMQQRTGSHSGPIVTTLNNCIFYNGQRSTVDIQEKIGQLFDTCVRTRLRRADAEGIEDEDGDEDE